MNLQYYFLFRGILVSFIKPTVKNNSEHFSIATAITPSAEPAQSVNIESILIDQEIIRQDESYLNTFRANKVKIA